MYLTVEMNDTALEAAIAALGAAAEARCLEAARVTAHAIHREAQARFRRQIVDRSGLTFAGIQVKPDRVGVGYVVESDREPYPNLPLWIDQGTKPGTRRNRARVPPRPYFSAAVQLEGPQHRPRVVQALNDATKETGFHGG